MLTAIIAFALGVFFAPVIKPLLRPILVEIIKLALLTSEEVKRMSAQVKEDIEDAAAEASAQHASAKQRENTDAGTPASATATAPDPESMPS